MFLDMWGTRFEMVYGLKDMLVAWEYKQIVMAINESWQTKLRRDIRKDFCSCLAICFGHKPENIERKDRVHALPLLERKEEVLSQGEERARA